jgi:hypothetical protein
MRNGITPRRDSIVNKTIFVISTGRCGTQWLAAALQRLCGDAAEVTHEPLHLSYAPRVMLGAADPSNLELALAKPILDHMARIETTLAKRMYIECGHPLWSTLPYLLRRFAGRACVVHLVRHPVPTAWSWVAQQAYCPPLAPHLRMKELLTPFDRGVHFNSYSSRWPTLHPYEKALYYWAEVNAFALRLADAVDVPWLRVRFEELFAPETLHKVLALAGISASDAASEADDRMLDAFHCQAGLWCDPAVIAQHPDVVAIAARLGYDALTFDAEKLRQRYAKTLFRYTAL